MKTKHILIGAGLFMVGYKTGKVVAYVKCVKTALNIVDEIMPGCKKHIIKKTADKIVDDVFESEEK